jgi:uncharacterized protein
MLLDISRMRGTRDRIDRSYPPSAFDAEADVYRVVESVNLAFEVFRDQLRFRLVGHVTGALELACSRCLEAFRLPVDAAFDLIYSPEQENVGEGEVEVADDDLSTAFYRDQTIDLGGLMREQFLLAVPMKPLCSDACRGLCPDCGTNWNSGACSCTPRWTDAWLEGLQELKRDDDRRHGG